MRSRVCDLFEIEFPILAFSHCRDVVAAVSKAGGMGVLGVVAHDLEHLEIDLGWIEAEIGDRPYGVDLIIPAKYQGSDSGGLDREQLAALLPPEHQEFLDELLERYQVPDLPDGRLGPGEAMFSANRAIPQLEMVLEHRVSLVANALGPPPPFLIEQAHERGIKVAALAGTAVHAERHVAAGVDLIVAQGTEAGGHTGEIGSMVLIPEIVDVAPSVPVLGAGGIGRGRQMAAAMALGAEGVWCGSVWLTTTEAETHPTVKQKMLRATSSDTVRSRSLTGKPARQLRSAWTDEWARSDTPDPLGMPLQSAMVRNYQARIERAAHDADSGAAELANYFVGQVVGHMTAERSASQVVFEMVEEFIDAAQSLAAQLD